MKLISGALIGLMLTFGVILTSSAEEQEEAVFSKAAECASLVIEMSFEAEAEFLEMVQAVDAICGEELLEASLKIDPEFEANETNMYAVATIMTGEVLRIQVEQMSALLQFCDCSVIQQFMEDGEEGGEEEEQGPSEAERDVGTGEDGVV